MQGSIDREVPARNVLLCCTHTRTGPNTIPRLHDAPKNTAYVARRQPVSRQVRI